VKQAWLKADVEYAKAARQCTFVRIRFAMQAGTLDIGHIDCARPER